MVLVSKTSGIFQNYDSTWLERTLAQVLKCGPMPNHVGFIMDGNRRYAKEANLAHPYDGHQFGLEKLMQVANMMFDLGVPEITFFMFSVDNFKRSEAEVRAIVKLIQHLIQGIVDGIEEMRQHGVLVEITGIWGDVPYPDLKHLFAQASVLTYGHSKLKINLAFSYSAHQEICAGVSTLVNGLFDGAISLSNLNETLLTETLALSPNTYPVDIIIRTAGDCRLSDFQLWQASNAYIEFIDKNWPTLEFRDLVFAILGYQRQITFLGFRKNEKEELHRNGKQNTEKSFEFDDENRNFESKSAQKFILDNRGKRWAWLKDVIRSKK